MNSSSRLDRRRRRSSACDVDDDDDFFDVVNIFWSSFLLNECERRHYSFLCENLITTKKK
jgi:hypothetical protein|tara:strand:+ start:154 stop:333 length:180 start_codon:yes stop_codon:yes gene_type:complete